MTTDRDESNVRLIFSPQRLGTQAERRYTDRISSRFPLPYPRARPALWLYTRVQFDSRRLACSLHVPAFSFRHTDGVGDAQSLRLYVYMQIVFVRYFAASPTARQAHSEDESRHATMRTRSTRLVHTRHTRVPTAECAAPSTTHIAVHTSAHAASHEDLRMRGRSIQSSTHTQHVIMLPQQRAALALP